MRGIIPSITSRLLVGVEEAREGGHAAPATLDARGLEGQLRPSSLLTITIISISIFIINMFWNISLRMTIKIIIMEEIDATNLWLMYVND